MCPLVWPRSVFVSLFSVSLVDKLLIGDRSLSVYLLRSADDLLTSPFSADAAIFSSIVSSPYVLRKTARHFVKFFL